MSQTDVDPVFRAVVRLIAGLCTVVLFSAMFVVIRRVFDLPTIPCIVFFCVARELCRIRWREFVRDGEEKEAEAAKKTDSPQSDDAAAATVAADPTTTAWLPRDLQESLAAVAAEPPVSENPTHVPATTTTTNKQTMSRTDIQPEPDFRTIARFFVGLCGIGAKSLWRRAWNSPTTRWPILVFFVFFVLPLPLAAVSYIIIALRTIAANAVLLALNTVLYLFMGSLTGLVHILTVIDNNVIEWSLVLVVAFGVYTLGRVLHRGAVRLVLSAIGEELKKAEEEKKKNKQKEDENSSAAGANDPRCDDELEEVADSQKSDGLGHGACVCHCARLAAAATAARVNTK
jgi:hypothetical protein